MGMARPKGLAMPRLGKVLLCTAQHGHFPLTSCLWVRVSLSTPLLPLSIHPLSLCLIPCQSRLADIYFDSVTLT